MWGHESGFLRTEVFDEATVSVLVFLRVQKVTSLAARPLFLGKKHDRPQVIRTYIVYTEWTARMRFNSSTKVITGLFTVAGPDHPAVPGPTF